MYAAIIGRRSASRSVATSLSYTLAMNSSTRIADTRARRMITISLQAHARRASRQHSAASALRVDAQESKLLFHYYLPHFTRERHAVYDGLTPLRWVEQTTR